MSEIGWFGIAVYGAVGAAAIRPVAGALAWRAYRVACRRYSYHHQFYDGPTSEQWAGALIGAVLAASLWPLVALFLLQGRRDAWTVGDERLARLEARERRVKETEKELGL